MSIVVETGSGVTGADCYVSVADADAYWLQRANTTWAGAGAGAKEAALLEATQYLDASFGWRGTIKTTTQGLGWPRVAAEDDDGRSLVEVPRQVTAATCELALLALSGRLVPSEERGGQIKRKREKVGPIEEETEYADRAPAGRSFRFAHSLVRTTAVSGPGIMKITRG